MRNIISPVLEAFFITLIVSGVYFVYANNLGLFFVNTFEHLLIYFLSMHIVKGLNHEQRR